MNNTPGLTGRCALLFLLALGLASPARAAIKIDYTVGFENTYRPESWIPMQVTISGASSSAAATLQLVVSTREGTRTYSRPIRLQPVPATASYTITYFQPNPGNMPTLALQIYSEGRKVAERKVEQTLFVGDSQPVLAALTQDRGGFGYLHKVDLGFQHITPDNRQQWNPFGGGRGFTRAASNPTRVLYPGSAELPDSPYAYKWVDAVILADLSLDTITDARWDALIKWVKNGGALIVSGGSDINRFRAKQLQELLPVSPEGVKQVGALSALADRYQVPVRVTSVPLVTGALRADSATLCAQGDVQLLSSRRLGNGVVIFCAFDLLHPEIRAWPGQPAMWEEIMQAAQGDLKAADIVKSATAASWNSGYRGLADALAGLQATEAPSFTFIGLFLLAYIILLVPVNYWLLRKWDRKELAWVTAPIIVLVFTTGAYAVGYSVKGGTLFLRYATIIEGSVGTDDWSAYTVASVFSPRQTRYDISVSDPTAIASEVTLDATSFRANTGDLTIERGRVTTVKDALVNMWDSRNFAFESQVDLGGVVNGSAVPAGNSFRVKITNNTRHRLEDAMVSFGGYSARVGSLTPGQGWDGSVSMGSATSVGRIGPVLENFSTGQTAAARIKSALSSTVINNETGLPGRSPLVFSGWFSEQVQGLTLEDERPRMEGQNLLVVHLPVAGTPGSIRSRAAEPVSPFTTPGPVFGANDANALNNRAYELMNQGRLQDALNTAYQALARAPQDGNILDTVGEMHQRLKQYPQAETYYRRALALQGGAGLPETNVKYGETLLALKRKNEAVACFEQVAARDSGPWGARARSHLTKLGIRSPTPGSSGGTTGPTTSITVPAGSPIPPIPTAPGRGRRRILQPQPNGGFNVIIQEWNNGVNGSSSSESQQQVGPGQPIPP